MDLDVDMTSNQSTLTGKTNYIQCQYQEYKYFSADESPDLQYLLGTDSEILRRSSALFLLKLKEQKRVSQVAVDEIVAGWRGLFLQSMEHVQAGVRAKLAECGVDPGSINGLDSVFTDVSDLFDGIETCHLYRRNTFVKSLT